MVNEMQTHAETTDEEAPEPPADVRTRSLSAGQIRAIFDAMRTFRDDDIGRASRDGAFTCNRCGRERALAGSVSYGAVRLCNGCATDYELLHTAGIERDLLAPPAPPAAAD